MTNFVIVTSSNFNDKDFFVKKVEVPEVEAPENVEVIVKADSKAAAWLKEMGITVKEVAKYTDILALDPTSTTVLAFWDGASKNVENVINTFKNTTEVVMIENTTLNSFNEMVEQISNEQWKLGCKELINKLPNYFWVVAASSSGKYHPKCDLGAGGLVRHSVMVATIAADLVDSEIFVDANDINKDMALIAGLFHDCLKQGTDCNGHTVFNHPILAADFIAEELKNYIEEPYLSTIVGAVRTHMGKWTTSKYEPDIVLEKPYTAFQKLIHTADLMASKKYISGLEVWN